jgi:hypothetical protein
VNHPDIGTVNRVGTQSERPCAFDMAATGHRLGGRRDRPTVVDSNHDQR